MTLAEMAAPACPPTRDIHCSRNYSAAPHSQIPGRLASSPSSLRISNAVDPLIHPQVPSDHSSESHTRTLPAAVVARSVCTPPSTREKSGEPLKSSLKVRRTHSRGSLSVITDPGSATSSKSAPATCQPTRGVRFHSQLEHVKLFVAKQKPLTVSRDGNSSRYQLGPTQIFPILSIIAATMVLKSVRSSCIVSDVSCGPTAA